MQSNNELSVIQPADNQNLSLALNSFSDVLIRAAEENINTALADAGDAYTDLERRAMVITEALRLTSVIYLASILTRGRLLGHIDLVCLACVHPNGYADLTALAREQGI